jgi:GNAT superfamily N-acetyltransferase
MPAVNPPRAFRATPVLSVVDDIAPPEFVSLCWDVFFMSRGRGVSMNAHFPWLGIPDEACYVILKVGADIVAGCALRWIRDSHGQRRAGAVGLVCVDERHRGQGHATRTLERAIEHARNQGLADLILWTGKPGVYEGLGFRRADNAVYGQVSAHGPAAAGASPVRAAWPDAAETRGLPPFAVEGWRWKTADASAIVLSDSQGAILAEWNGTEDAVSDLLAQVMPPVWRINALEGDALPGTLGQRGYETALQPSDLRMILPLAAGPTRETDYRLRVLDRI